MLGSLAWSPAVWADDARELAEAAVKAAGGASALPKIVHWKETFHFSENPDDKGTKREALVAFPSSWYQDGKDIAAGDADRTEKAYLVWVWTLGPLLDENSKLKMLPAATLGDQPIVGLRLTRDKQKDIDLYFHAKTYRLARIDWRTYRIDFADWKEADGFTYPTKAFVRQMDGSLYLRTEFQLFETLKELPKGLRK
ncbi:MAG: hypothetical protein ACRC1K_06160 [Planctomycetia bacterium]